MACQSLQVFVDRQMLRELPGAWRVAYLFFAFAYMLILGTGLMINPATISIFLDSVGVKEQPVAQTYLPLVLLPVLFIYNFFWAALQSPQRLVLVVCSVYAVIYSIIAIESFQHQHISARWAWVLFYATNTKSVLFPVMLWSVMNDLSSTQYSTPCYALLKKIAYPALVSAGQLGGLAGSLLATAVKDVGGSSGLLIMQAAALLIIAGMVWIACMLAARAPAHDEALGNGSGDAREALTSLQPVEGQAVRQEGGSSFSAPERQQNGCLLGLRAVAQKLWETVEGIALILSRPYVAGIFWVACAHLVPRVLLDYQGTALINERWPKKIHGVEIPGNTDKRTSFFAWCNVANTVGAMLLSLCGLRGLVERGGLLLTLLVLPTAMLMSVLLVCFHHDFWTVQAVLVVVNVVQYALNGPSREMLYVRTSKDIKYKAKSWSDMYGNFLQKTIAAQINLHVNLEEDSCQPNCFKPFFTGVFTTAWVAVWALIAGGLGVKHARLVKKNEFVS